MTNVPDARHDAPSGEHEQRRAASAEVDERVKHGAGEAQSAVGASVEGPDDEKPERTDDEKASS